jgi:DNA (cytosine-5)-methyltransferase 1
MCDLFSGCGGISIGVREACRALELRMEPVLAWDILEGAERVYKHNFKPAFFRMDPIERVVNGQLGDPITEAEQALLDEIGTIDLVVGGPPCQGNSDLNNHSRRKDAKNLLYLRMTRFIEIVRPKIAIIENVLTVRRAEDKVVQKTIEFLRGLGYGVDHGALRAMNFGVPQDRRRHFTVAILGKPFKFDSLNVGHIDQIRPVMWGIEDLKVVQGGSNFDTPATHQIQNRERIAWLFGEGWKDWEIEKFNQSGDPNNPHAYNLPDHRRPPCHQSGHNYPAVYGRMFPNLPSPTITTGFGSTGQGRFVHPHKQRSLTPHEAARVQTFPDFFDFSTETGRVSLQTLIGNAVPPLLAQHIALQLISRYHPEGS